MGTKSAPMVTLQLTNYRVSWMVTTGANVFYSSDIHRLLSSPQDLSDSYFYAQLFFISQRPMAVHQEAQKFRRSIFQYVFPLNGTERRVRDLPDVCPFFR